MKDFGLALIRLGSHNPDKSQATRIPPVVEPECDRSMNIEDLMKKTIAGLIGMNKRHVDYK